MVDQFGKRIEIHLAQSLIVISSEDLFVANRRLGRQVENKVFGNGADQEFHPAEEVVAASSRSQVDVVSADRGSPASVGDNLLKLESGEVIGQTTQALFDMFGEFESKL